MPILLFYNYSTKKSICIFLWEKHVNKQKNIVAQIYLPLNSNKLSVSRPSKMLHLKQGCFVREPKKNISRKAIIIIAQMMLTKTMESLKIWRGKSKMQNMAIWIVKFPKEGIKNYIIFFPKNQLKYFKETIVFCKVESRVLTCVIIFIFLTKGQCS